jgi:hypothetical protein
MGAKIYFTRFSETFYIDEVDLGPGYDIHPLSTGEQCADLWPLTVLGFWVLRCLVGLCGYNGPGSHDAMHRGHGWGHAFPAAVRYRAL